MGFLSRSESPEARYARILDGAHLWLAVTGDGPLLLRAEGRDDVAVPTQREDDLLVTVFPLAEAVAGLSADTPLRLLSGRGRKAVPVRPAADASLSGSAPDVSRDPAGLTVEVLDGDLVLRSRRVPGVAARVIGSTDDGVLLELATTHPQATLVVKDRVLGELALTDGRLVLGEVPGLEPGTTATLRIGTEPVVRAANVLARPNYAVALPPLPGADLELRWLKDGRIGVHRRAVSA